MTKKNKKEAEAAPEQPVIDPELKELDAAAAADTVLAEAEVVADNAKITELEKQLDEEKNKNLLLQADFQNYRKRVSKEIAQTRVLALYDTAEPFLRVFDYLQMAGKAAAESDNISAIRTGMDMIMNEYKKALDEIGVTAVNAVGEKFNPEMHEAVAHEPSDAPEGQVIKQWSCGYRLGEKLLRPAKVVVSSGSAVREA